jgi:hypothetical protein
MSFSFQKTLKNTEMKTKLMLLMAMGSLWIFSCSKSNKNLTTNITHIQKQSGQQGGGEDDDLPIIIIKHVNANYAPVAGSLLTLTAPDPESGTLFGQTDANGICRIRLPHLGNWMMVATHDGYLPIQATLEIVDSITTRTDTIQQQ